MKAGHYIVIGLVIWVLFSLPTNIWIYKVKAPLLATIIIAVGCVIWLTNKGNRQSLLKTFVKRDKDYDLFTTIRIGLIAGFSFLAITFEVSKLLVAQSEGFNFIKSEVLKSGTLKEQVGEIKYIAIGNSISAGISFKDSEKRLSTTLIVFGASGQIEVDVDATKTDNWKIRKMEMK